MEIQDIEKYTGLREDIEHLLEQFLHTQNVRFQMFAEAWRRLNFSFIHYGIEKGQEKRETMEEAFRITTDYLLPPYDLQRRVGALYILYALFVTQPHVPKFKIRISLEHWQGVTALVETLKSQGHLDAIYVFHKLTTSKAFMFTAKPKKMIFHTSYMEGKSDQNPTERWLERRRHSLMTECFDDATLELHHELHEQYQKMKVNLALHDNTSLMVVRESITENIVKRFEKLEADFEASRELNQTTDTSDPDMQPVQDQGSKISQIKARSFSSVAKVSRSRRHRQQTAQSSLNKDQLPAEAKPIKGKGRRGRKGKQKRTNQSSDTETSEDDDNSGDVTWTPHSVNKCKTKPRSKKTAAKGPWELLEKVRKLQAIKEEFSKENPPTVSDDEDSNVDAELGSDIQGASPLSKTRMPGKRESSIGENPETFTALKTNTPLRMQKGSVIPSETKTTLKRTRSADEPSNQLAITSKKVATVSRKASPKKPSKTTSKASSIQATPSKVVEKPSANARQLRSSETPKKRSRSQTDTPTDQKRGTSPEVTPKKKFRGSDKIKEETHHEEELPEATAEPHSSRTLRKNRGKIKNIPATPLKKPNSAAVAEVSTVLTSDKCSTTSKGKGHLSQDDEADGEDHVGADSRGKAGQHVASSRGHRSSSSPEQSSTPSPRGLRSASMRGRGSLSNRPVGARGQGSPLKEQEDLSVGRMRSPRPNTTLKMRGGGIGARTRGARKNVSK